MATSNAIVGKIWIVLVDLSAIMADPIQLVLLAGLDIVLAFIIVGTVIDKTAFGASVIY